jgi:hypothetical protein
MIILPVVLYEYGAQYPVLPEQHRHKFWMFKDMLLRRERKSNRKV